MHIQLKQIMSTTVQSVKICNIIHQSALDVIKQSFADLVNITGNSKIMETSIVQFVGLHNSQDSKIKKKEFKIKILWCNVRVCTAN